MCLSIYRERNANACKKTNNHLPSLKVFQIRITLNFGKLLISAHGLGWPKEQARECKKDKKDVDGATAFGLNCFFLSIVAISVSVVNLFVVLVFSLFSCLRLKLCRNERHYDMK